MAPLFLLYYSYFYSYFFFFFFFFFSLPSFIIVFFFFFFFCFFFYYYYYRIQLAHRDRSIGFCIESHLCTHPIHTRALADRAFVPDGATATK